jgi:hypothetical protein
MFSGNLLELIRYEIQGLVPGDTLEFSFAALPDTTHGISQAFEVIRNVQAGKTP